MRVPVPPSVVVVVLTWNGRALTMDCLRSLEAVATPNVRVMVVDNASTDGTAAAIRERYGERVEVVENASNLGYAGGNNVGIRRALDQGARFVLLLNNDTTVAPDFVDQLLGATLDPAIGIAAPKIYFAEPPDRIWYAGGEISLWRGAARHAGIREHDRGQHDTARDVDYASGCALLARREVFERVGLLDESYRAYFEDADLCLRAARAGFRVRYVPTAQVWHRISASTGGQVSRAKVRRKLESAWRFFRAHARPYHWITIPLFFALDVVRITGLVLVGRIRDADPL
ncbi:MAG TPA: glycosyltransferase family 2 protein [Candidatus Krumholzibacteria bacterium]|nr:glycosyltransferase family 2 protein [Candidatus Krumholzibacteria bacterium]